MEKKKQKKEKEEKKLKNLCLNISRQCGMLHLLFRQLFIKLLVYKWVHNLGEQN